jgi:chemotaxis protein methyltransferase CheR
MSAEPARAPTLSAMELNDVCALVYAKTGMVFGESKRYYIERRVLERVAQSRSTSVRAYLGLVRGSAAETEKLVNAFTVNETYFYREEHQLACLGHSLLPRIITDKQPGDKVRIWSVPCSSGEEPYSIAIWLLENWHLVDAYNIEIVGSDIDTSVLAEATVGLYGERATSRLTPALLEAYFGPPYNGWRQIIADLRESVTFTEANIIDRSSVAKAGQFDVIFCRNVLIYFDDAARVEAIGNLHRALVPGGYICLGHTETMSRISDKFETRHFEDAIVYQKPVGV